MTRKEKNGENEWMNENWMRNATRGGGVPIYRFVGDLLERDVPLKY